MAFLLDKDSGYQPRNVLDKSAKTKAAYIVARPGHQSKLSVRIVTVRLCKIAVIF